MTPKFCSLKPHLISYILSIRNIASETFQFIHYCLVVLKFKHKCNPFSHLISAMRDNQNVTKPAKDSPWVTLRLGVCAVLNTYSILSQNSNATGFVECLHLPCCLDAYCSVCPSNCCWASVSKEFN